MTTPGWKGMVTIKPSGGSHTEIAKTASASVSLPPGENDASVFGDEGEARTHGRKDATVDVEFFFDFSESTHTDILDASRDGTELEVRVHSDRDASGKYIQANCKVFEPSFDFSGGSNNTSSVQLRNSDGNKWSYSNT